MPLVATARRRTPFNLCHFTPGTQNLKTVIVYSNHGGRKGNRGGQLGEGMISSKFPGRTNKRRCLPPRAVKLSTLFVVKTNLDVVKRRTLKASKPYDR